MKQPFRWTSFRLNLRTLMTQADNDHKPMTPLETYEWLKDMTEKNAREKNWRTSELVMTISEHYLEVLEVARRCGLNTSALEKRHEGSKL